MKKHRHSYEEQIWCDILKGGGGICPNTIAMSKTMCPKGFWSIDCNLEIIVKVCDTCGKILFPKEK